MMWLVARFKLPLFTNIIEIDICHALIRNSLFFCDCCACLTCRMPIMARAQETVSTDAQQKLFVLLLSTEQRKYSPLIPPLFLLSLFLVQVLFCFDEENSDRWMDAILGLGLQWHAGGEKVGKLAGIWHLFASWIWFSETWRHVWCASYAVLCCCNTLCHVCVSESGCLKTFDMHISYSGGYWVSPRFYLAFLK